ncbi:MAG: pseudouridine synthase [Christensenellales bacterium]
MRINKYIAASGVCSRRAAEELITAGKVKVNGKTVTLLSTDIDETNDTVMLNGRKIAPVTRQIYIMFYKPKGCICSLKDEKGRKTVFDYLEDFENARIFPVGRLDYDTEGLLLLTNDGELSNKLTQPMNEIPKTYVARIEGEIQESDLARLRNGVTVDGVKLKRCKIKVLDKDEKHTRLEITIYEGKNREIHKMFETVGKNVVFLKRIKIGDIKLGGLGRGAYRYLTQKELTYLSNL